MPATAFYTPRSSNRKTGDIPHQFIGATREESKETCKGCPMLESMCYAQNGSESWAHSSVIKASEKGKDYSLVQALLNRNPSAKYIRLGAIGDPSGIGKRAYAVVEEISRKVGLGVLSYTHFWHTRAKWLKGHAMASCDTWEQAEEATDKGWRAALHVTESSLTQPQGKTPSGKRFTLCPAQRTNNKIQCNDCGLCDATKKAAEIILFINH